MEEVAKFSFVGLAAVALFTFLTVSHWLNTRATERRDRERILLLRKVADQPPATAELIRELLRDEEARVQAREQQKARRARHEGLQAGAMMFAIGGGLSVFLYAVAPGKQVWTLGIMLVLIGVVLSAFAYFDTPDRTDAEPRG